MSDLLNIVYLILDDHHWKSNTRWENIIKCPRTNNTFSFVNNFSTHTFVIHPTQGVFIINVPLKFLLFGIGKCFHCTALPSRPVSVCLESSWHIKSMVPHPKPTRSTTMLLLDQSATLLKEHIARIYASVSFLACALSLTGSSLPGCIFVSSLCHNFYHLIWFICSLIVLFISVNSGIKDYFTYNQTFSLPSPFPKNLYCCYSETDRNWSHPFPFSVLSVPQIHNPLAQGKPLRAVNLITSSLYFSISRSTLFMLQKSLTILYSRVSSFASSAPLPFFRPAQPYILHPSVRAHLTTFSPSFLPKRTTSFRES